MALRHNDIARNFRTEIAEEATFGTEPSGSWPETPDVIQLVHDDLHIDGFEQELLDVADAHVRRTGTVDAVVGQKRATTWRGSVYLKAIPTASQLTASGSSAQLSHRILFRHMFGTETVAAGSTVQNLSSTTSVIVGTGHGSRFTRGSWILVEVAGELEPTMVTAISTDTLTVAPALSATPTTSGVVRQGYNYAPKTLSAKTGSLTLKKSFNSAVQARLLGACFTGKFNFPEFGKLLTLSIDGRAADWTAPGALSYTTTAASDDMGEAYAYKDSALLFGDPSTLGRSTDRCPFEAFSVDLAQSQEAIMDGTASSQSQRGWQDVGGRPYPVTGMLKTSVDVARYTDFAGRTDFRLVHWVKKGTGTTASFLLWDVPNLRLKMPKPVKVGSRLGIDSPFHGLEDTLGSTTDHDVAPLRFVMF